MLIHGQACLCVLGHPDVCSGRLVHAHTCPNLRFLLPAVAVLACVCADGCIGSSTAAKADARRLQQD